MPETSNSTTLDMVKAALIRAKVYCESTDRELTTLHQMLPTRDGPDKVIENRLEGLRFLAKELQACCENVITATGTYLESIQKNPAQGA